VQNSLCIQVLHSPILAVLLHGTRTVGVSHSGRQPNFKAFSRGCQLYSAGWPSRWALAHILVVLSVFFLSSFCLLSVFFLFSLPIFSSHRECRSEMCCTQLAESTGCKNVNAKKSPSAHHRTTLSGCIFTTKACINYRKINLLNSNISST